MLLMRRHAIRLICITTKLELIYELTVYDTYRGAMPVLLIDIAVHRVFHDTIIILSDCYTCHLAYNVTMTIDIHDS
jgi:hypothetical protein